jgi:hypothetical protein
MAIKRRNRKKLPTSIQHRLTSFARDAREAASHLPAGAERHSFLERARLADTAVHLMDEWSSPPRGDPEVGRLRSDGSCLHYVRQCPLGVRNSSPSTMGNDRWCLCLRCRWHAVSKV